MIRLAHALVGEEGGYAAGRQLLQTLYRETVDQPMPPVVIAPGGKPCFADGAYHFSVSHTKRHVFCALSDQPIGMDAEEMDRNVNLRLAEKILSPTEYAQFETAEDKRKALLTFWVLKEAHAKFTGKGIRGYPNKTDFRLDDPRVKEYHNCLVAVMENA